MKVKARLWGESVRRCCALRVPRKAPSWHHLAHTDHACRGADATSLLSDFDHVRWKDARNVTIDKHRMVT